MKLVTVHLKKGVSVPPYNENPTAFATTDANGYDIETRGDVVVIGCPAWGDAVLVVPWSEVEFAHTTREMVTASPSSPTAAVKK